MTVFLNIFSFSLLFETELILQNETHDCNENFYLKCVFNFDECVCKCAIDVVPSFALTSQNSNRKGCWIK